ncbi:MAG: Uma2 family endonuclease [Ktedonobacterales bacterium]|nr:Uma2 family endonuclease [Ktedonobacterales bacterium]
MAQPDISPADYLAAERASPAEKHEYFDGIVRRRGPQPRDHATILFNIIFFLDAALHGTEHAVFSSDMRVQLSSTCFVYPDVAVSTDRSMPSTDDVLRSPVLAIEIFTPATVAFDVGQKALRYRACPTLKEYVLVDYERPFVHVQRRTSSGNQWEMRDYRDGEGVELRCLGLTVPMAAIYRTIAKD